MPPRKIWTCHLCNQPSASKQMLTYHINNQVCIKKKERNKSIQPTTLLLSKTSVPLSEPVEQLQNEEVVKQNEASVIKNSVGIDLDNVHYYCEILDDENIEIDTSEKISIQRMIQLFAKINQLHKPQYSHPLHSLVKRSTGLNAFMFNDIYKYYSRHSELCENSNEQDIIKHIFNMLAECYKAYIKAEIDHIENRMNRILRSEKERSYAKSQVVRILSSLERTSAFKSKVDKMFGEGYYDKIVSAKPLNIEKDQIDIKNEIDMKHKIDLKIKELREKKINELSECYIKIYLLEVENCGDKYDELEMLLSDKIEIRKKFVDFFDKEDNFEKFKQLFLESSGFGMI